MCLGRQASGLNIIPSNAEMARDNDACRQFQDMFKLTTVKDGEDVTTTGQVYDI